VNTGTIYIHEIHLYTAKVVHGGLSIDENEAQELHCHVLGWPPPQQQTGSAPTQTQREEVAGKRSDTRIPTEDRNLSARHRWEDAVSWPWLLPGAAQASAAHSHWALTLPMPATLAYSGAPARNPPTPLAPFFNIMSACSKAAKPASSPFKALHSYSQKYSSHLFLPAFSKGEFCFATFSRPATRHIAMTSCKSIDYSCQEPRTKLHPLNHGKPQHLWFDGCNFWQQCPKMMLSNSSPWKASKSMSGPTLSLRCVQLQQGAGAHCVVNSLSLLSTALSMCISPLCI